MPISTLSGVKENVLISDMFLQPEFLNRHRLYMHTYLYLQLKFSFISIKTLNLNGSIIEVYRTTRKVFRYSPFFNLASVSIK